MRLEPPVRATPILFLHLAGQLQFSSAGAGFEPASLSHACDLILAARRSCRSVFDAAPLRLFVRLGSPSPPCHWLRITFAYDQYKQLCIDNTLLHIHNYSHSLNTE